MGVLCPSVLLSGVLGALFYDSYVTFGVRYQHLTPKHSNVIDAVHFAELMYKGVDKEAEHYGAWIRRTEKFRMRKHDKIPANEDRWEDHFMFQFQLDKQCDWWLTFNWLSTAGEEKYDCENPIPGVKKRYKSGSKKRRR